jgi:sec-independent protein translocase protein TatA
MGHIGFQELVIILIIVLVLFGAKRIPEVGRSLGKGIREFKKATREITADLDLDNDEPPPESKPKTDS